MKLKLASCESSFEENKYSLFFFSFFKIPVSSIPFFLFDSISPWIIRHLLRSFSSRCRYAVPLINDSKQLHRSMGHRSFTRFEINVNGINKDSFLDNELS